MPSAFFVIAVAAAEAFLGRAVEPGPAEEVRVPGRFERRLGPPIEIRDGAHNPDGVRWLSEQLGNVRFATLCVSIVGDKDVETMLELLRDLGETLVTTTSSSARALPAAELASRAEGLFPHVEAVPEPVAALARAHELGEPVLVTGSLYLLADLAAAEARA